MVSCLFSPNPMRLEKVEWDHPADIDPICGQLGIQPASHAEQVHPWFEECSQSYDSQKRTSSFWLQILYSGKMYVGTTDQHIFRSCLQVIHGLELQVIHALDILITSGRLVSDDHTMHTKWTKLFSFLRHERLRPCHIQTLYARTWWFSTYLRCNKVTRN